MRQISGVVLICLLYSCGVANNVVDESGSVNSDTYLLSQWNAEEEVCFLNEKGDTIISYGKYAMSFTDTIRSLGMVMDNSGKCWGINKDAHILFEIFNTDNGPDYVEEGLFRIVKDDLIGYADELGQIVIQPIYQCAHSFEDGKAQVTFSCEKTTKFEMEFWESATWFYIDKTGKTVK